MAKLSESLKDVLAKQGLVFNQPDTEPFRQKLRDGGFYTGWREKYGEELWAILEKTVGKLT
jgi:hypothetical protein